MSGMIRTRFEMMIASAVMCAGISVCGVAGAEDAAPKAEPKKAEAGGAKAELTAKQVVQDFEKTMSLEEPAAADLGSDPLGTIADKMTGVHAELSEYKTDKPVQEKEKSVVSTLDQLIARLTPKSGRSGGGNNPNGPGRKRSMIVDGEAKIDELHGVDPRGKQWGQLPPKERERILQSRTEGFPAGYEALLQSYYQRLAQEKGAEEKDGGAAPAVPAADPAALPVKP
jgi:hypothetical protein